MTKGLTEALVGAAAAITEVLVGPSTPPTGLPLSESMTDISLSSIAHSKWSESGTTVHITTIERKWSFTETEFADHNNRMLLRNLSALNTPKVR